MPNDPVVLILRGNAHDAKGNKQIWIMDANGSNRVQITNDFNNEYPVWHPSGKKLVFVSDRADNNDIWMVELDGALADEARREMRAARARQ